MKREIYIHLDHNNNFLINVECTSPHKCVEKILDDWKKHKTNKLGTHSNVMINDIMPIHNASGIRDTEQILSMGKILRNEKKILHDNGLPNMKMVITPTEELLLFDGHHTALAHIKHGHKLLKEVPYLIFSGIDRSPITAKEISEIFPENYRTKVLENWRNYVINWQAKEAEQVEEREVESLKDLLSTLG